MKYDIKPNQSSIFKPVMQKDRLIKAIKIDVLIQKVREIEIYDCMADILSSLNANECDRFQYSESETFFVGKDLKFKTHKAFKFKSNDKVFNGSAILLNLPSRGATGKMCSTKLSIEEVNSLVEFLG